MTFNGLLAWEGKGKENVALCVTEYKKSSNFTGIVAIYIGTKLNVK